MTGGCGPGGGHHAPEGPYALAEKQVIASDKIIKTSRNWFIKDPSSLLQHQRIKGFFYSDRPLVVCDTYLRNQ
jgi:hypothetical protein